jgi:hypothetical protein
MYLQLPRVIISPYNGAEHVILKPKTAYISSSATPYLLLHHISTHSDIPLKSLKLREMEIV